MDTLQKVIFAKRVSMFNETFAPVGGGSPVNAFLWDQSTSGRKATDIVSVFHACVVLHGLKKFMKYWLDNCSGQNKNWILICHLILLVNSNLVQTDEIELFYFEPGHTFNSADSFHHQVEKGMKQVGKICTFPDFCKCVKEHTTSTPPCVVDMKYNDFFEPNIKVNMTVINKARPRPQLGNFKYMKFVRGNYYVEFDDDIEHKNIRKLDVFSKQQIKKYSASSFNLIDHLKFKSELDGIDAERKESIIKHLVPMMPLSKMSFWENMPVSKN